jgi:phosphosulfolactate phosphohydrolase-like enzyme
MRVGRERCPTTRASERCGDHRPAYLNIKSDLGQALKQCGSGRELIESGFEQDVEIASELDISECAPTLVDNAYINRRNEARA